jgi:hypothetical protein
MGIQAGSGFVEKKKPWFVGQTVGETDPLAKPSTEFSDRAIENLFEFADFHNLVELFSEFTASNPALECEVLSWCEIGVEGSLFRQVAQGP